MRAPSTWAVAACVAFTLAASSARAQTAEEGLRLYNAAQFQEAIRAFEAVLASAAATRADVLTAHQHLTALHVFLGDEDAATRHAQAAVALEPEVRAPEGSPPQVAAALDAARREVGAAARIDVTPLAEVLPSQPVAITATVAPAPPALIASIWLRCAAEGASPVEATAAPPRVSVEITPGADAPVVECTAAARTAGLADVARVVERLPVSGNEALAGATGGDDDGGGGVPFIWIGIGAGALALAAVIVVVVATSSGGDPTINEAIAEW